MAKTILVYGNPFAALDHKGQPCGCYPFDPDHNGGSRRWIGASINMEASQERTKDEALKGAKAQTPMRITANGVTVIEAIAVRSRHVFAFDLTPQPIPAPASSHYRAGVREGSLFPADEASAKALGVPAKDLRDPLELLAQARDAAIQLWIDQHGEPPPVDEWPANLQPLAVLAEEAVEQVPDLAPADVTPALGKPVSAPVAPARGALVKLDAKDSAAAPKESDL